MNLVVDAGIIIAAVAGGAVLNWLLRASASNFRDDSVRIMAAISVLTDHQAALTKIMESDSVEPELKATMLRLSAGGLSRDIARTVVDAMGGESPMQEDDDFSRRMDAAFGRLREKDPEMADQVITTIKTSFIWMILQWPETAARVKAIVELASEPQSQFVVSAFRTKGNDDIPHSDDGLVRVRA